MKWLRDRVLIAQVGSHSVLMDSPVEGADVGASPKMLLLAALGGCTAEDVISILEKQRQSVADVEVRVDGWLAPEHPKRYERIRVTYTVRGSDLRPEGVARAVELSEQKYCGVSATLRQATTIETEIVLEDTAAS